LFWADLAALWAHPSIRHQRHHHYQVLPAFTKLFSSNERSVRVHLLKHLRDYAPHLDKDMVSSGSSSSNAMQCNAMQCNYN